MLQLEPFTEDQGRPAVRPVRASRSSASLRFPGLREPVNSHACQTPWSVFQDGSDGEPAGRCSAASRGTRKNRPCRRRLPEAPKAPGLRPPALPTTFHVPSQSADQRKPNAYYQGASPAPIRFPPGNFKHSLTLFSKSFSSLTRGTCSLSVSRPYLALDLVYRPIWAAFPNNPTR